MLLRCKASTVRIFRIFDLRKFSLCMKRRILLEGHPMGSMGRCIYVVSGVGWLASFPFDTWFLFGIIVASLTCQA